MCLIVRDRHGAVLKRSRSCCSFETFDLVKLLYLYDFNFSITCYCLANGVIITGFTSKVLVFPSNEYTVLNVSRERAIEKKDIQLGEIGEIALCS